MESRINNLLSNISTGLAFTVLFGLIYYLLRWIFSGEMALTVVFSIGGVLLGILSAVTAGYVFKTLKNRGKLTVFLSYSHDSELLASQLANGLIINRISVVRLKDEIKPGEAIIPRLKSLIEKVDSVVVIVSGRSANSEWVSKEIQIAEELGKRIYPVIAPNCDPPPTLRNVMQIQVGDSIEETVEELTEALKSYYAPTSQMDLNMAAMADYQAAKAELERLYDALIQTMDDESKEELIEAQKAWEKFIEAQSKVEARDFRGGSGATLLYYDALDSLTRSRVLDLKRIMKEEADLH
jgi:uncharacterized protein YecT (DUF1311 family)